MKKLIIGTLCLLQTTALLAQQKFTIHGKVELLTPSKNIHVGNFNIPIKSDGSFEYSGEVASVGETLMYTDSAGAVSLWLQAGEYTIVCKEVRNPEYKRVLFNAKITNGPKTALIYDDLMQQAYVGFEPPAFQNKKFDAGRQKKEVARYMDSIFRQYPTVDCLPLMISVAFHYVGPAATKKYISMLTPELRKDPTIGNLETVINREAKLAEGVFEDFTMKTADGKDFTLSSLKGKKIILIDFWATDCAPCRAAHPEYVNLYKKYADKGLEIVSISLDTKTDIWKNSINQDHINPWINVSELKAWQSDLVKHYYINYIPFHLMLDGNRKIIKAYEGGQVPSEKEIIANLE